MRLDEWTNRYGDIERISSELSDYSDISSIFGFVIAAAVQIKQCC